MIGAHSSRLSEYLTDCATSTPHRRADVVALPGGLQALYVRGKRRRPAPVRAGRPRTYRRAAPSYPTRTGGTGLPMKESA